MTTVVHIALLFIVGGFWLSPTEVTGFGYDANAQQTLVLEPFDATENVQRETLSTYDSRHQLKTQTYGALSGVGGNTSTSYTYDNAGNVATKTEGTSSPVSTTTYLWGPQAKLRQATLPAGDAFGYGYDLDRRLSEINAPPLAAGELGYQVANQTFQYDYLGRITQRTRTAGATATWSTTYTNGLGVTTDPNVDTQRTMLDGRGRVSFQTFAPSSKSVSGLMSVAMSYDGQDQRTGMNEVQASGSYSTVYVYDGRQRLASESRAGAAVRRISATDAG